jgi:hypothetical protein
VKEIADFGKVGDRRKPCFDRRAAHPQNGAADQRVLPPRQLMVKARAER